MENFGNIEIRVTGQSGSQSIKPANFDIKYTVQLMQDMEDILYPNNRKNRPLITYEVKEGSVRHLFKTTMQTVIGFSAILGQVQTLNSVDFLEIKTAKAIENIQTLAKEKNFAFQIKTSLEEDYQLFISSKTNFIRTENMWVDAEFYFYGVLKDAGGKSKANIHLDTKEYGYLAIDTSEDFLRNQEGNLLYKQYGVRAKGKQNIKTGELDTKSLKLIELIGYQPKFDEEYLNGLINKAKHSWKGIEADEWLQNIRGGYEA